MNLAITDQLVEPSELTIKSKNEMLESVLFVLDQGWNQLIKQCTEVGASILLPNFHMETRLLFQTIVRQGKTIIATSPDIWHKMENEFTRNSWISSKIRVVLFDREEEFLFGLN